MGAKTGRQTVAVNTLWLTSPAYKAANKVATEEYVKALEERHAKQAKENQPLSEKKTPGCMSDAEVYECRDLYENCGWKPQQLRERYGVSKGYITAIVSYATRSKIILKEK